MKTQHIIIVAGMHRSGTSGVTRIVERLGVNVGEDIGKSKHNKYGFKEDVDFFKLHNRFLHRSEQSILVQDIGDVKTPTQDEAESAKSLIKERENLDFWGWKNPRTALFLDFWGAQIPEARFLFVYRHPIDVVLSLLRRGADVEALVDPMMALKSWEVYNRAVLNFFQGNRSRCCLYNIATFVEDIDTALAHLSSKLRLGKPSEAARKAFDPSVLTQTRLSSKDRLWFGESAPQALALYRELEQAADLPSGVTEDPGMLSGSETSGPRILELLERLDPKVMAEIPRRLLKRVRKLRVDKVWAEGKTDVWEVLAEKRERLIIEQASWISHLEEGRAWQEQHFKILIADQTQQISVLEEHRAWSEEQVENWKSAAEHREGVIAEQGSQISVLEEIKTWLTGQVESWQNEVAQRDRLVAEQAAQVSALEDAKIWLEGQVENWKGSAARLELLVAEQTSQLTEAEVGKRWFESQLKNWQGEVAHREDVIANLTTHLSALENDLSWLEEQANNWRVVAEDRDRSMAEQASHIEQIDEGKRWLEEMVENGRAAVEYLEGQVKNLMASNEQYEEGTAWLQKVLKEREEEITSFQAAANSMHEKLRGYRRTIEHQRGAAEKSDEERKTLNQYRSQLKRNPLFRLLTYLRLLPRKAD